MALKKGEKSKRVMIEAAIGLLNEKGYYGASTNEILSRSGAPRGSMYYHFPGGKDEIVIAAIQHAGDEIAGSLRELFAESEDPATAISLVFGFFQQDLLVSDFACGCPVSAVSLECSGRNSEIGLVCAGVFQNWSSILADYLSTLEHIETSEIEDLASLLFSLIEGALLVARSTMTIKPLEIANKHCIQLLK